MDKQHVDQPLFQLMLGIAKGEEIGKDPRLPAADVVVVDEHNDDGPTGMLFAVDWGRCPAPVKAAALELRQAISQNPAQ